jgi:hypothetical protein
VTAIWTNPEVIRYTRAQLRAGKVIATACIAAAISIVMGFALSHSGHVAWGRNGWAHQLLVVAMGIQALVLAGGGAIACVNSVYREKEQNTFDYQRVTKLTPLELALGKVFGAPVFSYFACLCLMPLVIYAAVVAKQNVLELLLAYSVLLVGSWTLHVLALLISLLTVKGSHTGAILFVLIILWVTSVGTSGVGFFQVGPFGPFYAVTVAETGMKDLEIRKTPEGNIELPGTTDTVFGKHVQHAPVFLAVDLMLTGWFLLGVVRNIKRDPNYYEVYSPMQGMGFGIFLNLLFLVFFRWQAANAIESQAFLLTLNIGVFFALGLAMIRNRERTRRILRSREGGGILLLDFLWPAPLLMVGAIVVGFLIVAGIARGRDQTAEWSSGFALMRTLFFVLWLVRDMQFLQWMSLRRGKYALATGVLFLGIFYGCVMTVLGSFDFFSNADRMPFSAFFVPTPIYMLDHGAWAVRPAIWGAAFLAQLVAAGFFLWLQREKLGEINGSAATPAALPV